ncbi:hypothetical protein GGI02_002715 [Coemansia sp. RSA 2322]|nr:hypothetical protein GGI02_002715 [Coemansia sp. RSA 2322]
MSAVLLGGVPSSGVPRPSDSSNIVARTTLYISVFCSWSLLLLVERVAYRWASVAVDKRSSSLALDAGSGSHSASASKTVYDSEQEFVAIEIPTDIDDMHLEKLDYTVLDLFWPQTTVTPAEDPLLPSSPLSLQMGAVESLPLPAAHHDHHRIFGDRRHHASAATPAPAASGNNKPVRSATICLSSGLSAARSGSEGDADKEQQQLKRGGTARGLFRASLRRYSSYRAPGSWIHRSKGRAAHSGGIASMDLDPAVPKRMPSAEDISASTRCASIEAAAAQHSASMPHLPSHVETLRTALPQHSSHTDRDGQAPVLMLPFPVIDFTAGSNTSAKVFEGSSAGQASRAATSGIAELRQKLTRRLSRSSRQSRRRSNSAPQHKRLAAASISSLKSPRLATAAAKSSLPAIACESADFLDCEAVLANDLDKLNINDDEKKGSSSQLAVGDDYSEATIGGGVEVSPQLLSESIECLLERRLLTVDSNDVDSSDQLGLPRVPLSASSSMASLSTSASSSLTLSDSELASGEKGSVVSFDSHIQGQIAVPRYSESSESEILDYEDFMYLSACENHHHQLLAENIGSPATFAAGKDSGLDYDEEARRWWPRCVLPLQNMQYMPKLSLLFTTKQVCASCAQHAQFNDGGDLLGAVAGGGGCSDSACRLFRPFYSSPSSESVSMQQQNLDPPRLLRARSEGALGMGAGRSNVRRMDFWDVLGRCPMRPTSSLALASLKDMARSLASDSNAIGSAKRSSDCENLGAELGIGDISPASDSDNDSSDDDGDGGSTATCSDSGAFYGPLLGLAAKQQSFQAASLQRGHSQQQRGAGNSNGRHNRQKRVLSEPMQYILYNSYLRYYGRPGEAQ